MFGERLKNKIEDSAQNALLGIEFRGSLTCHGESLWNGLFRKEQKSFRVHKTADRPVIIGAGL